MGLNMSLFYKIFLTLFFANIFFHFCCSEEEITTNGESLDVRHPSMFKIGEEWLALPEVFSNLNFAADNTPAAEDDIEGQLRLRSTRFWGRLYIEGWPQTIQFFRAHFGIEPPIGKKRFVFAEPRDACSDLINGNLISQDHILLVNRGTCTFGMKAKMAEATNASSVIIINNEPGLDHLPGPDAHDLVFSVASIAQTEGQLLETVYDQGPAEDGFGRKLEGYMIPINCENTGAVCKPATVEENQYLSTIYDGGLLKIKTQKSEEQELEYLLAHFGTKVPHDTSKLEIVMAKPPEACTALTNDVKGKVVLVRRGSCPYVKKSEIVQAAGGTVMIVGSLHPYILRMGVEPRWKGLNTMIPVAMVSKRAYSIMLAESYLGGKVTFKESPHVNGTTWEYLEKLANGDGWPRSAAYVDKKYEELKLQYQGWDDRLNCLEEAYEVAKSQKQNSGDKTEL
jgi:hypothetical protein